MHVAVVKINRHPVSGRELKKLADVVIDLKSLFLRHVVDYLWLFRGKSRFLPERNGFRLVTFDAIEHNL